jgi:hypothetical protein
MRRDKADEPVSREWRQLLSLLSSSQATPVTTQLISSHGRGKREEKTIEEPRSYAAVVVIRAPPLCPSYLHAQTHTHKKTQRQTKIQTQTQTRAQTHIHTQTHTQHTHSKHEEETSPEYVQCLTVHARTCFRLQTHASDSYITRVTH